jgi:ATP-dependent phosphofructokinase / diphosphate-dependent phosphofructokinase
MNKKVSRIAILTGGGDCPGLNPAIKAIVMKADTLGIQTLGIKDGWLGMINEENKSVLTSLTTRHIDQIGGTILGSSRTNPYKVTNGSQIVKNNFIKWELDALIAIGGEDTLGVANKLFKDFSLPIVGIPKTIDLDLNATDYTLGFSSAINVIVENIDRLRTTAASHKRLIVLEVMGRHAGHLALISGISSSADMILIPEYKFELEKVYQLVKSHNFELNRDYILVVSEGAALKDGKLITKAAEKDAFGHERLGGIGEFLAKSIEENTKTECRHVVLSHLQRGGIPSSYDREMGFYFGSAAIDAVQQAKFGQMVASQKGEIKLVPLADAVETLRLVDVIKQYDPENYNKKTNILI